VSARRAERLGRAVGGHRRHGLYVIATTMAPEQMNSAKVVATYKSLAEGKGLSSSLCVKVLDGWD